jgi:uncharacterized protein
VWMGGRMLSYAAAGAFVAAGVGLLAGPSALASSPLRLAWAAAHAAVLALGLWLLVLGRQPAWLERLGRPGSEEGAAGRIAVTAAATELPLRWWPQHPSAAKSQTGAASAASLVPLSGLAWALMPCGLLQSALLVAALASSPAVGAMAMAGFALASAPALLAGPALLRAFARLRPAWGEPQRLVRVAGLMCIVASSWALGHGLWRQAAGYC